MSEDKNILAEKLIRGMVRKAIMHIREKKERSQVNEHKQLRSVVRQMLLKEKTAIPDKVPHKSTGINVLEDLLKKIVPVIGTDYKSLTTDPDQRKSYRAHLVKGVENTLSGAEVNVDAPEEAPDLEEEIEIDVGSDEDKFIDIRSDKEIAAEEEPKEDPADSFGVGLEDEDKTGRNMAYSTFKKIEQNILDSFDLLSSDEDQEVFYDYLKTNLLLYMDKFEDELSSTLPEPTTPEYEKTKGGGGMPEEEGVLEIIDE